MPSLLISINELLISIKMASLILSQRMLPVWTLMNWYIRHVIASELIIIMQKCPYNYCISHIIFFRMAAL